MALNSQQILEIAGEINFVAQYKIGLEYFEHSVEEACVLNKAIFSNFLDQTDILFKGHEDMAILDVGVSTGAMSKQFVLEIQRCTTRPIVYTIVEPDADFAQTTAVRLADNNNIRIKIFQQPLQSAITHLAPNSFDIILASHSFYHYPSSYIIGLANSLRAGGVLFVILSAPRSATRSFLSDAEQAKPVTVAQLIGHFPMQSEGNYTLLSAHTATTLQLPNDLHIRKALFSFLRNQTVTIEDVEGPIHKQLIKHGWDKYLPLEYDLLCVRHV